MTPTYQWDGEEIDENGNPVPKHFTLIVEDIEPTPSPTPEPTPTPAPVPTPTPSPTPTSARWGSVGFPKENGELKTSGANGGLVFPDSDRLFELAGGGALPFFTGGSALVFSWDVPFEEYNGTKRQPCAIGTRGMFANGPNRIDLGFVSGCDNLGSNTRARSFRLKMRGSGSEIELFSQADLSPGSYVIAAREDGTNVVIDLWNCDTGAKIEGSSIPLPSGWAGIAQLSQSLGVGLIRADNFPEDDTDVSGHSNIGYARGFSDCVLLLDDYGADADFAALALGGDPMTLWPDKVRAWAPLTDGNGGFDASVFSNLPNPTAYGTTPLAVKGALLPGSTVRRQSQAAWLKPQRMPDPVAVAVKRGTTSGPLHLVIDHGGLTPGEAIEMRLVEEGSENLILDWHEVATVPASGEIVLDLLLERNPDLMQVEIRAAQTGITAVVCSIAVGYRTPWNGQSGYKHVFGEYFSIGGNPTVLNTPWGTADPAKCFVYGDPPINETIRQPAVWRAAFKPGLIGDGCISYFNKLAAAMIASEGAHYPLFLDDVAVSGTKVQDMLADGGSPDNRDWSDVMAILRTGGAFDPLARVAIGMWGGGFQSSSDCADYPGQITKPQIDGVPTSECPVIDHFPCSGIDIDPDFDFVQMPPTRGIPNTSTTDPARDHDDGTRHVSRGTISDPAAASAVGYIAGPQVDVHRLNGNEGSHPDRDHPDGSPWLAKIFALTAADRLGFYSMPAPIRVDQTMPAQWTDGTQSAFYTYWTSDDAFALATRDGQGGALSLFEVDGSKDGHTTVIHAPGVTLTTKDSGSWPANATFSYKIGGPGGYGAGYDEDWMIAKALVRDGTPLLVEGTFGEVPIAEA